MSLIMGIDLGSTSIKAVVYDLCGNMVSEGSVPTTLDYNDPAHPSWSVWHPEVIWTSVCEAVKQAVTGVADPSAIKSAAVTGFGMDGLPLDKDGKELYPLISWHCPRTDAVAREFSARLGQENIFGIAGAQLMIINSIYRMIWMKENHPEILDKTDKWLLIEDYINFKLCGVKSTDFSMAWNTSVLDQKKGGWSQRLIAEAGIPLDIFPEIKQSGEVLGTVSKAASESTGLPQSVEIVLGGHDYICGALAVGVVDSNVLLDVTGTWEMVLQADNKPVLDRNIYDSGFYVQNHVVKDSFCYVGSSVSGDMTEWFKNNLSYEELQTESGGGDNVWTSLMNKAAGRSPGANGCFFLPHFSGAGAPLNDSNSLGAYIGLSNDVAKDDMIRATIEGLSYQLKSMVGSLELALGVNPERILVTGGATKNKFWMQNKADVTGKIIEVPDVHEATPLGAAILGGIGTGCYKNRDEAIKAVYRQGSVYEPDAEAVKKYDELYTEIYRDIYDALKNVNRKIFNKFRK